MKTPLPLLLSLLVLPAVQSPAATVDFAKDISPIFEKRCLECHGPDKQKGKLRLDQKDNVLKRTDPIVVAGDPDKSELIRLVSLPKGHDDIMPNKGEPLTKVQIDLLRDWVSQGANWPEGFVVGMAPAPKAGSNQTANDLRAAAAELRSAAARLEAAAAGMDGGAPAVAAAPVKPRALTPEEQAALAKAKEVEQKAIAEIEKAGVSVRPIALNVDWKEANFRTQGTNISDASIAPLKSVFTLVDLNLAATKVSDRGLMALENLTNLTTLHLENTGVTDAGLAHLKRLDKLTYLNLYNTPVTDAGLEHLKALKSLKKLYVWQTKVTPEGAKDLQTVLPKLEVSRGAELALVKKEDTAEAEKKAKAEADKKEADKKEADKKEADKKEADKKEADKIAAINTQAADKVDPTGTWKWSMTTQNGQTRETVLKLKLDGDKLTGSVSGRNADTEITNGKIKGEEISFDVTREFNGNKFTAKYSGKISGNTIKGKVDTERDGETRTREWEAKKEAPEKKKEAEKKEAEKKEAEAK